MGYQQCLLKSGRQPVGLVVGVGGGSAVCVGERGHKSLGSVSNVRVSPMGRAIVCVCVFFFSSLVAFFPTLLDIYEVIGHKSRIMTILT